jgi:hypothetical protein
MTACNSKDCPSPAAHEMTKLTNILCSEHQWTSDEGAMPGRGAGQSNGMTAHCHPLEVGFVTVVVVTAYSSLRCFQVVSRNHRDSRDGESQRVH